MNYSENCSETITCFLDEFTEVYDQFHIPLSGAICAFGVISHCLNILVLTRKHMKSPSNTILTGLSMAQLLLVSNYIMLLFVNFSQQHCVWPELSWGRFGATYKLITVNLNIIFHTVALSHAVVLAIFRFVAVTWPAVSIMYCRRRNAKWCSSVICIFVPIQCIPVYFASHIVEFEALNDTCPNTNVYTPSFDLDWVDNELLITVIFWVFAIGFKIIPSLLILVFGVGLLSSMSKAKSRKTSLGQRAQAPWTYGILSAKQQRRNSRRVVMRMFRTKTTRFLLVVILLCVGVELPHGILNLLVAINGSIFAARFYDLLGDFFEMLTLLYSSINFVLFCLMSSDFKHTFMTTFSCRKQARRPSFQVNRSNSMPDCNFE